jgi:hypothetical protein
VGTAVADSGAVWTRAREDRPTLSEAATFPVGWAARPPTRSNVAGPHSTVAAFERRRPTLNGDRAFYFMADPWDRQPRSGGVGRLTLNADSA